MYNDSGFTLTRRPVSTPPQESASRAPTSRPKLPSLPALRFLGIPAHRDVLRRVETAFFAAILGGFALTASMFAAQLLT